VAYRRLGHFFERHTESAVGVQVRRDWLDPIGPYRTMGQQRLSTTREDEVSQTMLGLYAQSEIEDRQRRQVTGAKRPDQQANREPRAAQVEII
jgi:hypothetical protein